jgi:hypothetical protein
MLYELRQYTVKPGKQAEWIKIMEEEIIPLQVAAGMVICGSFAGEDESVYVWLRRFKDEEERVRLYEAVYQSDKWKNDIAPRVPDYLERDKIVVTRMSPTAKSVMQ